MLITAIAGIAAFACLTFSLAGASLIEKRAVYSPSISIEDATQEIPTTSSISQEARLIKSTFDSGNSTCTIINDFAADCVISLPSGEFPVSLDIIRSLYK